MATDIKLLPPPAAAKAASGRESAPVAGESVVRFDVHQRIQHFLMMSSFIVLALTGLPQKFSDLGLSQWWVSSLGGLETVRMIHRTAGLTMLADCLYHLAYLSYRIGVQRRLEPLGMIPTLKDMRDAARSILYYLGLTPEKPSFGRYSYLEKFDYWAVFWGIAVIGGSGLVLMFAVDAARIVSGEAISAALIVHGDEAVLAVGWIAVVHLFNVHLAPWAFPMNRAIFTGRMSAARYAEEHPLEWRRLESAHAGSRPPQTPPTHRPAPANTGGRSIRGLLKTWHRRLAALLGRMRSAS
jgi:cytochrome b subunit of formate dehydrogenase